MQSESKDSWVEHVIETGPTQFLYRYKKRLQRRVSFGCQTYLVNVPNATITTMPLTEGETAEYDTLQDALDAFGIKADLAPQYIPERFTLETVTGARESDVIAIYADYTSSDGYLFIQYRTATADSQNFEMEGPGITSHQPKTIPCFMHAYIQQARFIRYTKFSYQKGWLSLIFPKADPPLRITGSNFRSKQILEFSNKRDLQFIFSSYSRNFASHANKEPPFRTALYLFCYLLLADKDSHHKSLLSRSVCATGR